MQQGVCRARDSHIKNDGIEQSFPRDKMRGADIPLYHLHHVLTGLTGFSNLQAIHRRNTGSSR